MAIEWIEGDKKGQIEHSGCVLTEAIESYLGGDQYSYHVKVWTGKEVIGVGVASGYCDMTYTSAKSNKDAAPEVIQAAAEWTKEQERKQYEINNASHIIKNSKKVRRDDTMVVVSGRKHPIGLTGKVFWVGQTRYGMSVGFKTVDSQEAKWIAFGNVEKVLNEEEQKEVDEAEKFLEEVYKEKELV